MGWRNTPQVGAGRPLDNASKADIAVLTPPEVPAALPTATASSASIAVLPPVAEAAAPAPAPADPVARLGAVISLIRAGGPQTAAAIDTALKLTDDPALAAALSSYKASLPPQGPVPPPLLLVEAARAAALPAPQVPTAAPDTATQSWWRQQLSRFITFRRHQAPATQPNAAWGFALAAVQVQLAAGAPAGALATLSRQPLAGDPRLDTLRALAAALADNEAKLAAVTAAYLAVAGGTP